ncbi:MAG: hypothetical protein LBQ77_07070 [Treponema sp.]|nr:hypothetical protein [Treponema sp.]
MTLSKNIKRELLRKLFHVLIVFTIPLSIWNKNITLMLLIIGTIFYAFCEELRISGIHVPFISFIIERVSRVQDRKHKVIGPITLGIGAIFSVIFYEGQALFCAICATAFGDSIACLVGMSIGNTRPKCLNGKSVEGSMGWFYNSIVNCIFVASQWNVSIYYCYFYNIY